MSLDKHALTEKQRIVLDSLIGFIQDYGYPPTIPQLCERCGVSSTSTIHHHVSALKRKGFIHWNPNERRSITVHESLLESPEKNNLPLLGTIAAGSPLQTVSDTTDTLSVTDVFCPPGCYALKVKGDSMIEDHILDGDVVVIDPTTQIHDGNVVVALVENETATLKRIYREKERVRLQPANQAMDPIFVTDIQVQGKVIAVLRSVH